jgi:DNA-binding HxlR family transcriptional regulator
MRKKSDEMWEGCPIRFGMGIFGDKWTLLIIRDLMFKGKKHFGEFSDPEENISTNILTDRLTKLQDNGIVTKQRDPSNNSKYVYRLTKKGVELLPVMLSIIDWSEKYDQNTEVPREFVRKLRSHPERLKREIVVGLNSDE